MTDRPVIPQSVRAIVLDTNTGSRGLPNLTQVEELVDVINAQELECQVVIPELVLWEWAEHVHALATATKASVNAATRRLETAGIEGFASVDYSLSIEEVIELLEGRLAEHFLDNGEEAVQILRLADHPSAAIGGLRDQVLQIGAGRTKPDSVGAVKTGAADSAVWRLVTASHPQIEDVVIVTADRDVYRHFNQGAAPIVVKDVWAAKNALLKLQNGSEMAREAVVQAVTLGLPRLSEDSLSRVRVAGALPAGLLPRQDPMYEPLLRILEVERVVGVDDVEVSRSDESATASASVELRMAIDYLRWDSESETLEADLVEEWSLQAYAQVSAESSGGRDSEWNAWIDDVELSS